MIFFFIDFQQKIILLLFLSKMQLHETMPYFFRKLL